MAMQEGSTWRRLSTQARPPCRLRQTNSRNIHGHTSDHVERTQVRRRQHQSTLRAPALRVNKPLRRVNQQSSGTLRNIDGNETYAHRACSQIPTSRTPRLSRKPPTLRSDRVHVARGVSSLVTLHETARALPNVYTVVSLDMFSTSVLNGLVDLASSRDISRTLVAATAVSQGGLTIMGADLEDRSLSHSNGSSEKAMGGIHTG